MHKDEELRIMRRESERHVKAMDTEKPMLLPARYKCRPKSEQTLTPYL